MVAATGISWQFFPTSDPAPTHLKDLVQQFDLSSTEISSATHDLASDAVVSVLRPGLLGIGYQVELSKKAGDKIKVPVLFGRNGRVLRSFDADAYNADTRTVLEIEAGRAFTNYQFLKDLFQACMMVDVDYLAVALRHVYKGTQDFEKVTLFFDTLYASRRLELPLRGVLLIGY
jgi:hypothetical protein